MRKAEARVAIAGAQLVSSLVRSMGIGEGAALPGRILIRLYPEVISGLSKSLPAVLISGTNAKTTTTALTREALSGSFNVTSNITGANMDTGIAFSLAARKVTAVGKDLAVFEVDEAYLPDIGSKLETKIVALLNLSRDQLDRVSETRMTASKWSSFLKLNPHITVVANCDDPLVVFAAQSASEVLWVSAGLNFFLDAYSCPVCGGEIDFSDSGWRCRCGFSRPSPDIEVSRNTVSVFGRPIEMDLSLPGQCNVANSAIALGICQVLDVDLDSAARRMSTISEVAGRYKRVSIDGHEVRMLLSKNPAGWVEVFDMVGDDSSVVVAINAQLADGKDPSWLWDVPFEFLKGKEVFACGERAYDLSVRLHYAEVSHVVEKDSLAAIRACGTRDVSFVGNYTSFQELRNRLNGNDGSLVGLIRSLGNRVFG